jgi:hypothetical protein
MTGTEPSQPITVSHIERAAVFDFSFDVDVSRADDALVEFSQRNVVDRLWRRYDDSFVWIFYGSQRPAGGFEGSPLARALPGTYRFVLEPLAGVAEAVAARLPTWRVDHTGWSVLISPEHGAGVASFWCSFESETGPRSLDEALAVKRCELVDFREVMEQLAECKLRTREFEREYPFVAIKLAQPQTARSALAAAPDQTCRLGRLFTGGYEHEEPEWLSRYVAESENLSRRLYERLFVRWTDALAVYDHGQDWTGDYEREWGHATTRAAQLLEVCVLVRRILRNVGSDIERAVAEVGVLRPGLVWGTRGRLLGRFTDVERAYKVAPPFRSSEGERLLDAMFEGFGVNAQFEATREAYRLLERRLVVVESQYVLSAGVLAFLVNALVQLLA